MLIEPIQTVWMKEQSLNENYLNTKISVNRDIDCEWHDMESKFISICQKDNVESTCISDEYWQYNLLIADKVSINIETKNNLNVN